MLNIEAGMAVYGPSRFGVWALYLTPDKLWVICKAVLVDSKLESIQIH